MGKEVQVAEETPREEESSGKPPAKKNNPFGGAKPLDRNADPAKEKESPEAPREEKEEKPKPRTLADKWDSSVKRSTSGRRMYGDNPKDKEREFQFRSGRATRSFGDSLRDMKRNPESGSIRNEPEVVNERAAAFAAAASSRERSSRRFFGSSRDNEFDEKFKSRKDEGNFSVFELRPGMALQINSSPGEKRQL